jgi:pimeloyl-ACP methyl ester carboxylesterase
MHGAGSPGSASFDLAGASLMRALACAGFDAYALDARGFGGSSRPPDQGDEPAVRATAAARDLDALVGFAARTSSVAAIDLIGWSWGADVSGLYAGLEPDRVRRLILLAPVYDRRWPSRHITRGAWREEKRADMEKLFTPDREDRAVWDDFLASLFRFGDPAAIRLPNGPYRDIYGEDAPGWDAAKIRAPVLIARGDQDKAALDANGLKLFADLTNAAAKRYVVLGGLGHFLFREKRRAELYALVIDFLQSG